jgi:hypothetical protein
MSDDNALWFSPDHKPPSVVPAAKPREHVWAMRSSLREGAHRIDCELMIHGEHGWDCVLSKDGDWFFGRRFHTRGEAMIEADELKARYLKSGGELIEKSQI